MEFIKRADNGGLKRFKFNELDEQFIIKAHGNVLVPYLEGLQIDLSTREQI